MARAIPASHPNHDLLALCAEWEVAFVKWDTWPDGDDDAFSKFYDDEVSPRFEKIASTPAVTLEGTKAKARVLFLDNASSWSDPIDEASRCSTMALMAAICRELDPSLPVLATQERLIDYREDTDTLETEGMVIRHGRAA